MVFAPVGIRCPDHAGGSNPGGRAPQRAVSAVWSASGAIVTRALVIINIGVFFLNLADGATLGQNGGRLFIDGALLGRAIDTNGQLIGVAEGEWYRMITSTFLHGSLIHLGLNMLMLYWIGTPMEQAIGHVRFLLIYLVSGLSGSAMALVFTLSSVPSFLHTSPAALTVGASGAIFGILGAALVYERQRMFVLGGSALSIIVINLLFTFAVPNISKGGHVGGLIGGALCALALSRLGRVHGAYGRPGVVGFAGVAVVALAAVFASYLAVQSY
jgi:membrane associated rhomboid family serine protease